MQKSSRILFGAIVILAVLVGCVWYAVFTEDRRGQLTVTFLNVGQGDATFIDAPSGAQVLVDGGPSSSVLRELSRVMPWYDRTIDLLLATHPDADHIAGLVDVLERYEVAMILISSVDGNTALADTFDRAIQKEGAEILVAQRGQVIDLGKGAKLNILFPDRDVSAVETNVGCIVSRLEYGESAFMLPCDATDDIEKYVAQLDGESLKSSVLKAAHHGSKTSSAPIFVGLVAPEYAVYSRGCDNSYGHPHQETVNTFARFEIPTLDTCVDGRITFLSNGQKIRRK